MPKRHLQLVEPDDYQDNPDYTLKPFNTLQYLRPLYRDGFIKKLKPADAVFCYLVVRANRRWCCWPSVKTIAKDLGLGDKGERIVYSHLAYLEKCGAIRRGKRTTPNGNEGNVYVIMPLSHIRATLGLPPPAQQRRPRSRKIAPAGPDNSSRTPLKESSYEESIGRNQRITAPRTSAIAEPNTWTRGEEYVASLSDNPTLHATRRIR